MIDLFPHQRKVLEATKGKNRVAYYLDMGLGKTFVGSEKMLELGAMVNLLVCQKSKIPDWIEHFLMYYPQFVYDLTKKKELEKFMEIALSGQFPLNHAVIGVINYDVVYRRTELKGLSGYTLMLDESSIIQNEKAKRSKFIIDMNPKNVILLSGTPTDGKYERLWSQLHLLGWGISKDLYMKQYVDTQWIEDDSGFKIPIIAGYKNVDRLKDKLAFYGAVFMKSEEAFTLPQQIDIPTYVSASRKYREFVRKSVVTVKKLDENGSEIGEEMELIGDTRLTKRMYCRMLCGQFSKEKLQAFTDLIWSTNERLIVFYNFNEELELLTKVASTKTEHISIVNGQVKDLQNYSDFDDSITFIQYQAGAMGLNLQKANRIVYYSLPQKYEHFEQSKKRIHRIGQERTCFYHYLLCRNSVELDILETLKMRKDYTDALFEKYMVKG